VTSTPTRPVDRDLSSSHPLTAIGRIALEGETMMPTIWVVAYRHGDAADWTPCAWARSTQAAHLQAERLKEAAQLLGEPPAAWLIADLWHQYQRGEISRERLRRASVPVRMRLRRLLRCATASEDRRARAFGRDLLRLWPALWTFLRTEGVEPTNNRAEQALRSPVIRRKLCFGSQSGSGLRTTERLLSVTHTCRQHGRNLLRYLTEALTAHRQGLPAPALLPTN
jgi:hypothetical protein